MIPKMISRGKSAPISSFANTGVSLDLEKTTINGQKLDEYMSGNYTPYSAEDLFDTDTDINVTEYDQVQEYRFHAPRDFGENPEIHLVLHVFDLDDWQKSVAEFTFDLPYRERSFLSRRPIKKLKIFLFKLKKDQWY